MSKYRGHSLGNTPEFRNAVLGMKINVEIDSFIRGGATSESKLEVEHEIKFTIFSKHANEIRKNLLYF